MPSWTALPFELKYLIFEHFITSLLQDLDIDHGHGTCTTIYWYHIRAWAEVKKVKELTYQSCEDFIRYITDPPEDTYTDPMDHHLPRWISKAKLAVHDPLEAIPDFRECFKHKFDAIKASFEKDYLKHTGSATMGEKAREQGAAGLRLEVLKHLCLYSHQAVFKK